MTHIGASSNVPAARCPSCAAVLTGAAQAGGDAQPGPGDITVCIYCAEILAYTDTMGLREADEDDLYGLDQATAAALFDIIAAARARIMGATPPA